MCPSLQRSYFHGCKISDNSKQYFKSTTNELKLLFSLPSVQLQPVLSRSLQCFNFNPHCTYASGVIKAAGRPIREKEGRDSMCVTRWAGSVACITDCCVTRLHSQHCSLFRCLTPPSPSHLQISAGAAESELNPSEPPQLTAADYENELL